jgi:spermidine synthase
VENVLVIGYGTGSIVEVALKMPGVRKVTLVEINATLLRNLKKIPLFQNLLSDPRLEVVVDDGRRYLITHSKARYDIIFMDPLRTTTAYSNNIYSQQFFQIIKDHLTEYGTCLGWLDEKSILPRTVASVFETVRLYNYFVIGSRGSFVENAELRNTIQEQFPPEYRDQLRTNLPIYIGDRKYVLQSTSNFPINTDWKPWTEYYLGRSVRDYLRGQRGTAGDYQGDKDMNKRAEVTLTLQP